jgi:hypothetical protein
VIGAPGTSTLSSKASADTGSARNAQECESWLENATLRPTDERTP